MYHAWISSFFSSAFGACIAAYFHLLSSASTVVNFRGFPRVFLSRAFGPRPSRMFPCFWRIFSCVCVVKLSRLVLSIQVLLFCCRCRHTSRCNFCTHAFHKCMYTRGCSFRRLIIQNFRVCGFGSIRETSYCGIFFAFCGRCNQRFETVAPLAGKILEAIVAAFRR